MVIWDNRQNKSFKHLGTGKKAKSVIIIEFEGTVGYVRRTEKGYLEVLHIQHLNLFLKKLAKHFQVVLLFEKQSTSAFFSKIMDLCGKLTAHVAIFAVSQPRFHKKTDLLKAKIKAAAPRLAKRYMRNSRKNNLLSNQSVKMFLDIAEIESFFHESAKYVIFSPVDKDVFLYRKLKSQSPL